MYIVWQLGIACLSCHHSSQTARDTGGAMAVLLYDAAVVAVAAAVAVVVGEVLSQ